MQEFDKKVVLKLPQRATLDDSYQQTKVRSTNAKGKTNLRPEDIPKSILIIPYGSRENDKTWAVSEPQLTKIKEEDVDGTYFTRYQFGMHLSCSVHGSPYSQQTGDCDVAVEVCYKPKSDK